VIAVIGTGSMGSALAEGLLSAGHAVTVYNRTREKALPLQKMGAHVVESAAQALTSCESAIVVLPDGASTRQLLLAPSNAEALDGRRVLSVAHTSASEIVELANEVAQHGGRLAELDITVYPELVRSHAGHFYIAAEEVDAQYWRGILDTLGKHVHFVGPVGNASRTEFALWLSYMFQAIAVAYSAAAFKGLGLPDDALVSALVEDPTLRVTGAESYIPQMVARQYATDIFSIDTFALTAGLVIDEAEELGLVTAPLREIRNLFLAASAKGHGADDVSAVYEALLTTDRTVGAHGDAKHAPLA
jgi:3-hydroxyisobutyrate dehydrogenase-like beta-hydroxyacid dehydrogenase